MSEILKENFLIVPVQGYQISKTAEYILKFTYANF